MLYTRQLLIHVEMVIWCLLVVCDVEYRFRCFESWVEKFGVHFERE